MRILENSDKRYSARWDYWDEWLEHVSVVPPVKHQSSRKSEMGSEWAGSRSYEEAMELATKGWHKGAEDIATMSRPVIDGLTSIIERPVYNFDVEGQSLDIGQYLNGDPECFVRQSVENVEGWGVQHLRIVYNQSVSAAVDAETLLSRGSLVVALVEALEFAGRRVELWVGASINFGNGQSEMYTRVKRSEGELDLPMLAFSVAHPSAFRRLMFAGIELLPKAEEWRYTPGYGWPTHDSPADIKADVNIGGLLSSSAVSVHEGTQRILTILKEQGVHVKGEAL